ncbi:hypothetical protein JYB62_04480 [Algoriphagus lutimaris]|uniref:hypothetical protein n=1 Tax=Algoriphagus lutimaris TaxID=613197 RepID=UPI00196B5EB3|nr:hypothetical protein [Algoriphagus lutimaris]MBN3519250.1 hypothetical protein [Algoriphagus lutimaris]
MKLIENLNKPIGSVIYSVTENEIRAVWNFINKNGEKTFGRGYGKRVSTYDVEKAFVGKFEITYTDQNSIKNSYLLEITFDEANYELAWKNSDGKTLLSGIGIENGLILAAGWN